MLFPTSIGSQHSNLSADRGPTILDTGSLPIEGLALLALREGQRPRPIYQAHRWFARRFGSAFRSLLVAASLPVVADFWEAYYAGVDWYGRTLLDPFVGGGTSVVEALRLGANVLGIDVDPVACAITRFELRMAEMPDMVSTLEHLKRQVGEQLAPFYQTVTADGEARQVLHYFWVQVVDCAHCGQTVEAHPHYQLAYEAEGTRQWAFCSQCHQVQTLNRAEEELHCRECGTTTSILQGTNNYGRITCPSCKDRERLIEVAARTHYPPQWRLFALETLNPDNNSKRIPLEGRQFQPATSYDQEMLTRVRQALESRKNVGDIWQWIPSRPIPREGRADDRLLSYGYHYYWELFNPRQLLHLSYLAEAIHNLKEPFREAMGIAFSDHLLTNCMMTQYAFGWRRLTPLFSVRAYRHISRPVEINPWMDGTGRGTFPNAVRQVQRAIESTRAPKELLLDGGFSSTPPTITPEHKLLPPSARIVQANSQRLSFIADESIDFVLTDPPYFDNIAYSELSDFFLPWLQLLGLVSLDGEEVVAFKENLAAKARGNGAASSFEHSLRACLSEVARVLKPDGRLVFTYQHHTAEAWYALALALAGAGFQLIQLFPLLGDSNTGLHKHDGSSKWDAVFVGVKHDQAMNRTTLMLSDAALQAAQRHYTHWAERLEKLTICSFGIGDQRNFYRACLVAGALGSLPQQDVRSQQYPLQELLEQGLKKL